MKKKEYQKPAMRVVKLQQQARLLAGSIFTTTSTNLTDEDEDLIKELGRMLKVLDWDGMEELISNK